MHDALRQLHADVDYRRRELEAAQHEARFASDVVEMEAWISEKITNIRLETER